MGEDRVRWIMNQFFKGCYLFRVRSQDPELWGLFNPNGRPVEAEPIESNLIARLLTAGWIERQGVNMVASQKGLCALACGKTMPMDNEPTIEWVGSCNIIQVGV